jgi:putative heme-binding domain-containing protein
VDREDIVTSTDNWFRPSAIRVAPDGSVFVADWYDPGVGGHGMGDTTRGRVYRLAPKEHRYQVPKVDLESNEGLLAALGSPNLAVRYMAMAKLRLMDLGQIESFVANGIKRVGTSEIQARLLWRYTARLLGDVPPERSATSKLLNVLERAGAILVMPLIFKALREMKLEFPVFDEWNKLGSRDPRFVELLFRSLTTSSNTDDPVEGWKEAIRDEPTTVRREHLLSLRNAHAIRAKPIIIELAKYYDGKDRFYLAALGIAVGTDPRRREVILADFDKHFTEWNDKVADLVWELRPPSVLRTLSTRLTDVWIPAGQRARMVDILATSDAKDAGLSLLKVLQADVPAEVKARAIENLRLFLPGKWAGLGKSQELKAVIDQLLGNSATATTGLELVAAAKYVPAIDRVAKLAADHHREAIWTLGQLPAADAAVELEKVLRALMVKLRSQRAGATDDAAMTVAAECVAALGTLTGGPGDSPAVKPAIAVLQGIVTAQDDPIELKRAALSALAGTRAGTRWLLDQHAKKALPADLVADVGRYVRNTPYQDLRNRALIAFPPAGKLDLSKLPSISDLAGRRGDPERGKQVLAASLKGDAQCLKCHAVRGEGGNVGPDLSNIGTKASRENLYESILYPSKAIADQFIQWNLTTTRGVTVSGLLVEETGDSLTIRDANGKDTKIAKKDIESREKYPNSLMPADIVRALSEDDLVNLVEYLFTLR